MDDQHTKLNTVVFELMRVVAYTFLGIYAIITVASIIQGDKDIQSSMKDATINIMMVIVGYVFGTSAGSRLKDLKPETKKELLS